MAASRQTPPSLGECGSSHQKRRFGLAVASNTQLAARQDRDLTASNKGSRKRGPRLTPSAASEPRLTLGVQIRAVATGRPPGLKALQKDRSAKAA
jgi:hypothetical protein